MTRNITDKLFLIAPLFILLFIYKSNVTEDFGFHNDFAIWAGGDKCCLQFVEATHLINIGRFIQAYLQGILIYLLDDISDFKYARLLSIIHQYINYLLLYKILRNVKFTLPEASVLSLSAFLTIPALLNLSWVTNYIPGIFNLSIVLISVLIYFESQKNGLNLKNINLILSFIFLLISFFIYPPTSIFFFVIPTILLLEKIQKFQFVYDIKTLKLFWEQNYTSISYFIFYFIVASIYFIIHKLFVMNLLDIKFGGGELYNFSISYNVLHNFFIFFQNIIPALINFFQPKLSPLYIILYLSALIFSIYKLSNFNFKKLFIYLLLILFISISVSLINLISSGGPPEFYRSWHGLVFILLLIIYVPYKLLFKKYVTNYFIYIFFLFLLVSASTTHSKLINVLVSQLNLTKEVVNFQYENNVNDFILLENRDINDSVNWGEFSFIHVLADGIVNKLLEKDKSFPVNSFKSFVINDKYDDNLFLATDRPRLNINNIDVSNKFTINNKISALILGTVISNHNNNSFSLHNMNDGIYYTFWESQYNKKDITISYELKDSKIFKCYSLTSGIDNVGDRMPSKWTLFATNGKNDTKILHSSQNINHWPDKLTRYFPISTDEPFIKYFFEIESSINSNILRIYDIKFYNDECS